MKKERLSILVLVVEIAAVIYLHSVKTNQSIVGNNMAQTGKSTISSGFQLKALHIAR